MHATQSRQYPRLATATRCALLFALVSMFWADAALCVSDTRIDDRLGIATPEARKRIQTVADDLALTHQVQTLFVICDTKASCPEVFVNAEDRVGERNTASRDETIELLKRPGWERGVVFAWAKAENTAVIHVGIEWTSEKKQQLISMTNAAVGPYFRDHSPVKALGAAVTTWGEAVRRLMAPSYWQQFQVLERTAIGDFVDRLRNPSWKSLAWFVPLVALPWILLEFVFPWRTQQRHLRAGIGVDLFYTVLHKPIFFALIGAAVCGVTNFAVNDMLYRYLGIQNLVVIEFRALPPWLRTLLALLAADLSSYWIHRLLHHNDYLWEFHKVHHSARELDVFNAIRQHFVEILAYRFIPFVPLGLIGFGAVDAFQINLFISVFSFFTHANTKLPLGPLKYVLNNPQMHVWHHTIDVHERGNVNFGDALSIWDFVFGTAYIPEEMGDLKLGFEGIERYPTSFAGQLLEPFKGCWGLVKARFSKRQPA